MTAGSAKVHIPEKLSVVVGSSESSRSIVSCLDALQRSVEPFEAEIIVVQAGSEAAVLEAVESRRDIDLITLPPRTLTPRLWSEGVSRSTGDCVALITGHCIVVEGWAAALVEALHKGAWAAGGPMRLARDASILDTAIFLLRYSAFISGPAGEVKDIAGDNSAYLKSALPPGTWSREDGFWELDVNRAITAEKGTIAWCPDAIAEFTRSFTFTSICRQRFEHGRKFGAERVSMKSESRARVVGAAPFVPLVLMARIGRRVINGSMYRTRFFLGLPLILALAACWAAGEAVGALDTTDAHRG